MVTNKWRTTQGMPSPDYDFNIITLSNRFLLFINQIAAITDHWLYDYKINGWSKIKIDSRACTIVSDCQIGAFPIPVHYLSEEGLAIRLSGEEYHEIILFGGISDSKVYQMTLHTIKESW